MADELGKYSIGVELNIRDLTSRVASAEGILGRVEKTIDDLDEKGKKAGSSWFQGLAMGAGFAAATTAIHGVVGALELIPKAIVGAVGVFDSLVGAAGRYAKQLEIQATMVGSSVKETEALSAGLGVVTGSSEAATFMLLRLSRAVGAASGGQLRIPPKQAFAELGVSLYDAERRGRPFAELMDDLQKKFANMPDGPRKTALALAIFGFQGGKTLETFKELAQYGATYQQAIENLGLTIDAQFLPAAAHMDTMLNILHEQSQKTFTLIGAIAAPSFMPLVDQLINLRTKLLEWVVANKNGIQDVASTIAKSVSDIISTLNHLIDQLQLSSDTISDIFIEALDLASAGMARFAVTTAYAIRGITTLRALNLAAATTFSEGPMAGYEAFQEYSKAGYDAADMIEKLADTVEERRIASEKDYQTFRAQRDEVAKLVGQYEELKNAGAPSDELAAKYAVIKGDIDGMGESYMRLNEQTRLHLELLKLHEPTVKPPVDEAPKPGAVVPQYSAADIEKATSAVKKFIAAKQEEYDAVVNGTKAKADDEAEMEKFKAAGSAFLAQARAAAENAARVKELSGVLRDSANAAKALYGQLEKDQIGLGKEQLRTEIEALKLQGDTLRRAELTKELKLKELEEVGLKERDEAEKVRAMRDALDGQDRERANIIVTNLVRIHAIKSADRATELAESKEYFDKELALYDDYAQKRVELDQKAAEMAKQRVLEERADMIDLRQTFMTVIDDMNEGLILGTKKMSQVWKSAWQSLEKEAEKAIVNTALTASGIQTKVAPTDLIAKLGSMVGIGGGGGGGGGLIGGVGGGEGGFLSKLFGGGTPTTTGGANEAGSVGAALANIKSTAGSLFGGGATGPSATNVGTMTVTADTVNMFGGGPMSLAPGTPGAPASPAGGAEVPGGGPPAPAAAGGAPPSGGGGTGGQPGLTDSIENMGSAVVRSVTGLGTVFSGVGQLLLVPLKIIPNLLTQGVDKTIHSTVAAAQSGAEAIKTGTQKTVGGITDMGQAVGGTVTALGGLVGGKAGQIISLIGEVITAIFALIAAGTKVLGTGQTGGYFENGGLTRPTGVVEASNASAAGGIPFIVHPGEGLINPRATELLGGRDAIMNLNQGLVPARLAAMVANGIRVQMPSPAGGALSAGSTTVSDQSSTLHIHPGAIVVNAPPGANGEQLGQDLMRGIISTWNR